VSKPLRKIAVFASGNGSNAQRLTEYFREKQTGEVVKFYTNNLSAFVIKRAEELDIPIRVFDRYTLYNTSDILKELIDEEIHLIVLAGFLWLVPLNIIQAFPKKIINIHPALLPKYGGKGMYGMNVHKAVIDNKDTISGISIHYVDEEYDRGEIIFQASCPVDDNENPESLAAKIHALEYAHFPREIEKLLI